VKRPDIIYPFKHTYLIAKLTASITQKLIQMPNTPNIHPTAKIMKGAIIDGEVTIGENTFIGSGAVVVSNGGNITIGNNTVVMENAVVRSAEKFNCSIGSNVLVGPKACITGAVIQNSCFIATNGTIFHGAELLSGTVLAVNAIVHINTFCPANTFVPIAHIAFGNPAKIYSPAEIMEFHADLRKAGGFVNYVYGIDATGLANAEIYQQLTEKFISMVSTGD